ncbi:MAG TPA: hypothetical protein VFH27_02750 [Longimicrobiaceae bacterium]|nr:hypothetical protein [Longimicrobiaceae bacterium]
MSTQAMLAGTAWVTLGGHAPRRAELEVTRYPWWAWAGRSVAYGTGWVIATVTTMVLTMDPFVTALPFFTIGALAWRSLRGRYLVRSFRGDCPRCSQPLTVEPGSTIGLPHPLVCYHCHHEPRLAAG